MSVKAPEPGTVAANGGHNRSMTFHKPASAGAGAAEGEVKMSAQEALENKIKEIEERKREVAEKEKAMAAKKAEEGKAARAVLGTA